MSSCQSNRRTPNAPGDPSGPYSICMNETKNELLRRAEALALESYGCGLDRLDPSEVEYYTDRVTADNLDDLADDLAHCAWMAN
jgi:hypothetical protein